MRSSSGHIHGRLSRHSRRRRLMLVSYDAAACPSLDDEHFDEQILLDPEILASINASAEAMSLRSFSSKSLLGAASNLVSGAATGSAVLADFPEVECEITPKIDHNKKRSSEFDSDSIFEESESTKIDSQKSGKILVHGKEESPRVSPPSDSTTVRSSKLSLSEYLQQEPGDTTTGMQQIRGWLHHQQPRVWMFLGDETTAWLRHSGQPGFAEMFRHRLRWELRRFPDLIVNAGVKNASLDEMLKIAKQGLAQCHPDVAFILPGQIDGTRALQEPHRYSQQLRELTEFLKENGTEPVLQTPPLPASLFEEKEDDPMRLLCDLIREVAVVNSIPLIDHAEFWQEQTIHQKWVDLLNGTVTQAGQAAMALLFFTELDIFDRSSELCGKLEDAWEDTTALPSSGTTTVSSAGGDQ